MSKHLNNATINVKKYVFIALISMVVYYFMTGLQESDFGDPVRLAIRSVVWGLIIGTGLAVFEYLRKKKEK